MFTSQAANSKAACGFRHFLRRSTVNVLTENRTETAALAIGQRDSPFWGRHRKTRVLHHGFFHASTAIIPKSVSDMHIFSKQFMSIVDTFFLKYS